MAVIAVWLKIDEERIVQALQEGEERLDSVESDIALDFSSVRRIGPSGLRAIERFADMADIKGVKLALLGVDVGVYKVLKLVNLASRFSFMN